MTAPHVVSGSNRVSATSIVGMSVRFDPSTDDTIVGSVAEVVSTEGGFDTAAVSVWRQSAPFDSTSPNAICLRREQAVHPLACSLSARMTVTQYADKALDIVVLIRSDALDIKRLITRFERLGARTITTELDRYAQAAVDLELEFDDRIIHIAAAAAIVLSQYLDSPNLSVAMATSSAYDFPQLLCNASPDSSIVSILQMLEFPTSERLIDPTSSVSLEPGAKSIGITDFRDASGVFLQQLGDRFDIELTIHPGSNPRTARVTGRSGSAKAAAFLSQALNCISYVYPQIRRAGPDLRIRDLQLSNSELRSAQAKRRGSMRIEEYVSAHSAARPESIAIVEGATTITYRDLDDVSNRVAMNLWNLGVRPGDFVALASERTADMYIAMLSIFRCGAAYVPIDIEFPVERIIAIISDSASKLTIIEPGLQGRLPENLKTATLAELKESGSRDNSAILSARQADASAYAIFTSGTTGYPKGTVVTHSSVVALVDALRDELSLSDLDIWSNFHSPAFDFSVWEIWGSLITGGTIVVVSKDIARDPGKFHEHLRQNRVTILSQTPSAFGHLATFDADAPVLDTLRVVVLGGEPMSSESAVRWLDRYPRRTCRLVNMYGITETTVHVTVQDVDKQIALRSPGMVGRAIPGWQYCVVGPDLRPAPLGFPGEIYVAGAGLALYYMGKPALTATRFVAGHGGTRWYRSGDLGRILSDGTLEHLGRIDNQIKINGYRIELAEIKNAILRQPGVRDAVVVCNSASTRFEVPRLDAYVVGPGADLPALRSALARFLPEYMIPATFTELAKVPMTINGKVDYSELPKPKIGQRSELTNLDPVHLDSSLYAGKIKEAWSSVLGAEPSIDDNFFLIGGNSLAAIHFCAELKKLGLQLPLTMLYANPTPRQLMVALGGDGGGN